MKLNLNKQQILGLISNIHGFTSEKATIPITGNFYLKNSGGKFSMVATDLEIQATAVADLGILEDFAFTLPAKKFKDAVTALPTTDAFVLELNAEKAIVKAGKTKYTLQTLPAAHFPILTHSTDVNAVSKFSVSRVELYNALELLCFAQGVHDARPFLNASLLEMVGGVLNMVATDAHRLSFASMVASETAKDFTQIIPRKTVATLISLTKKSPEELVYFTVYPAQVVIQVGSVEVISKVVDGKYPDYRRVIPNFPNQCKVNSKELLETIQRIAVIGTDKLRSITLTFAENLIKISCKNETQETSIDEVACTYTGTEVTNSYNIQYWIELLSRLDVKDINISIDTQGKSNLVTIVGAYNFSHTMMPLRG